MFYLNMKWESYYLEIRGRPKTVPSALETSGIVDVDDDDYGDEDDFEEDIHLPCST